MWVPLHELYVSGALGNIHYSIEYKFVTAANNFNTQKNSAESFKPPKISIKCWIKWKGVDFVEFASMGDLFKCFGSRYSTRSYTRTMGSDE